VGEHDDRVGGIQRVPAALGQVALGVDGEQLGARAIGHRLRHALGVPVTGVINDDDFGHERVLGDVQP